jgi:hypothetical protein
MASKLTKNSIAGDILIVTELAKHLKYSLAERQLILRMTKKGMIAVETMLEEAISRVGKLTRSEHGNGEDFIDGTDAKKGVVSNNDTNTRTKAVTIGRVSSKVGDLRIMASDPLNGKLFYFRIPNHELKDKCNIKIMFGQDGDMPKKLRPNTFSGRCWLNYQVKSFKELCLP